MSENKSSVRGLSIAAWANAHSFRNAPDSLCRRSGLQNRTRTTKDSQQRREILERSEQFLSYCLFCSPPDAVAQAIPRAFAASRFRRGRKAAQPCHLGATITILADKTYTYGPCMRSGLTAGA